MRWVTPVTCANWNGPGSRDQQVWAKDMKAVLEETNQAVNAAGGQLSTDHAARYRAQSLLRRRMRGGTQQPSTPSRKSPLAALRLSGDPRTAFRQLAGCRLNCDSYRSPCKWGRNHRGPGTKRLGSRRKTIAKPLAGSTISPPHRARLCRAFKSDNSRTPRSRADPFRRSRSAHR